LLLGTGLWGIPPSQAIAASSPIRIGVIAPKDILAGKGAFRGTELAVSEINSNGGVLGRPLKLYKYNSQFDSKVAVRAFQRAVLQDHVVAMLGGFGGSIGVALVPWTSRLKTPYINTVAADDKISETIHDDWPQSRYAFQLMQPSSNVAHSICTFAKDVLVGQLHYKRAAIFVENAQWTKPYVKVLKKCLPKVGLKVVDTIQFGLKTQDFSPIFSRIEKDGTQALLTAIAYVTVKPIVQWKQNQIPVLIAGSNGQGTSTDYWKATNGAAAGTMATTAAAKGVPMTPKTQAFYKAFKKRFHTEPQYSAYYSYDGVYTLKDAIERAGTTDAKKLDSALEKTDFIGVSQQIKFTGPKDKFTHSLVYEPGKTTGVMIQWQYGKQVVVWPKRFAQGKLKVPKFVKNGQSSQ
jgi:branched-chain amino acid transport system substrate-binding protein